MAWHQRWYHGTWRRFKTKCKLYINDWYFSLWLLGGFVSVFKFEFDVSSKFQWERRIFIFGVAFVVYLGNHLAIVTTNYDLNIYKYSICDRTTEDPIYTLPDVRKIHYTEYGYKLLVLKTNGKLYHLSKVDDDMILLYISDNVIDMYSDHFICTGLNPW